MGSRRGARLRASAAAAVIAAAAFAARTTDAHKAVTSKYSYNKDVYPLLRDHCGQCHVAGGPAPMSLLTYKDAVAWAEAVRDEITAERMPPWPLAPQSKQVKGAHPIDAHDLDVIVTWASGGTPLGPDTTLPDAKFDARWALGAPDLKLQMDAPHTLPPGTLDETRDFTIPTNLTETRWVKAADLLPSNPALARDAIISVEGGAVLALWQPGGDVVAAPDGAAFKLPAGAKLHLQMHYKKHFDVEQEAVSDRSTIGLYFTAAPASGREVQTMILAGGGPANEAAGGKQAGAGSLTTAARIVAVRPMLDRAYGRVDVGAVLPNGSRTAILSLNEPRPQWFRRYWLQQPVSVPTGTRLAVTYQPLPPTNDEPNTQKRFDFQVAVDYVPN
jgi:mono/diheme cytochrome c family protein